MLYSIKDTINKNKPNGLSDDKIKLCENVLNICMNNKEIVIEKLNNATSIALPYLTTYMAIMFKHLYYPSNNSRPKYIIEGYNEMSEMEQLFASCGVSFGENQTIKLKTNGIIPTDYNFFELLDEFTGEIAQGEEERRYLVFNEKLQEVYEIEIAKIKTKVIRALASDLLTDDAKILISDFEVENVLLDCFEDLIDDETEIGKIDCFKKFVRRVGWADKTISDILSIADEYYEKLQNYITK